MTIIVTSTARPAITHVRIGHPTEPWTFALPGETLAIRSNGVTIAATETVAAPAGTPPEIDDATPSAPNITIAEVGRYHFRVTTTTGETADVSIIACESACLDWLPTEQRSGGAAVDKTRVLRELARYELSFTGTAAELANKPLGNYGA